MGPDDPSVTPDASATPSPAPKSAPAAASSDVLIRTIWPNGDFHIEDAPTITREGVQVSADKADELKAMADKCGVRVVVSEVTN